jgi:hypothetical protein
MGRGGETADEPTRLRQLVDWELALSTDHVHSALRDLAGERWESALPTLLDDFQQLLRDALDLLRELGEADDRGDRSHWDLPSITPHWQNQGFRDWVSLIELLRDAWLAILAADGVRATRIAWLGSTCHIQPSSEWPCLRPVRTPPSSPRSGSVGSRRRGVVAVVHRYRAGGVPTACFAGPAIVRF